MFRFPAPLMVISSCVFNTEVYYQKIHIVLYKTQVAYEFFARSNLPLITDLSHLELHSTLILIYGGWLLALATLVSYFTF